MILSTNQLTNVQVHSGQVRKITYADGGTAYVFKKARTSVHIALTRRRSFPPVNRNEPMTKSAYRRTLNRYFERLIELDLEKEKCLFLTLTICRKEYNSYEKISDRFKCFTNNVRFSNKVSNSYLGAVRFIEVQQQGFFHVHCVLVFNTNNIKLTWKDLHRMWGWGYVKVKPVYDYLGLIDYLTNPKHGVENEESDKFTRYPKGARVIYISPNLPKCKCENISITAEECVALLQNGEHVGHLKIHKYFDKVSQSVKIHIDKMALIQLFEKRR